jgi:hypothetical protein
MTYLSDEIVNAQSRGEGRAGIRRVDLSACIGGTRSPNVAKEFEGGALKVDSSEPVVRRVETGDSTRRDDRRGG